MAKNSGLTATFAVIHKHWLTLRQHQSRRSSLSTLARAILGLLVFSGNAQQSTLSFHALYPHVAKNGWSVLDPIRLLLQSLYLLFGNLNTTAKRKPQPPVAMPAMVTLKFGGSALRYQVQKVTQTIFVMLTKIAPRLFSSTIFRVLLTILATAVVALTISLPMDASAQAIMLLAFWAIALWVRETEGRIPLLLMIVLSVLVSTRYLLWRVTQTINWDVPLDATFGLILLSAELYAWLILVLGYIQTAWPLQRKVAELPESVDEWPHVDIFIPSYNEPLSVVRPTILAAISLEWPSDKLSVHVLDDGKREEFRDFCERAGVGYIARPDNSHAKAGNLNYALKQTQGDYVAIFDCDHIPTRSFLQLTVGWFFKDPKLALVQTPHHFFSPDPFEKNLAIFRNKPNENELFYGLIQDGNDLWNSSFFCGSCAILKRGPLEEVGGVATETVTEDAHTALKMHRLGYTSAYLNIPQAAGLATESLADHIGQRIRWARGMAQIFRLDNPIFGKGLNLGQRICYANAMLYFFNGIPRVIFMLAPLAFLLLGSYIIFAPAVMIAAYALPHIIHSYLTNARHQGAYRHSFWAEMYETVLAWYILRPTAVALFAPHRGKFNVTAKGGNNAEEFFDWKISKPYLLLISISIIGAFFGVWRLVFGPADEYLSVVLNLVWITYNLIILGGAISVAEEAKQVRRTHRISTNLSATLVRKNSHAYAIQLYDFSLEGAGLLLPSSIQIEPGEVLEIVLPCGATSAAFEAEVVSIRGNRVGVLFKFQDLEAERRFICATFGRANAWLDWRPATEDKPMSSFREVVGISLEGYRRLAEQSAPIFKPLVRLAIKVWSIFESLLPQKPQLSKVKE